MDVLQELLAEREIRQLLSLYPQYADDRKAQEWAELFTPDGVLVPSQGRIEGHPALTVWLERVQASVTMRHLMVNAVIFVDSVETARSQVDLLLLKADGPQWSVLTTVRYNDRLVKTTQGWRFQERVIAAA